MIVELKNEFLSVQISSKGAELTSIKNLKNGMEYLWQADPKFWNRHAPILFPVVGTLRNNQYSIHGKQYELSSHGFARDKDFSVSHKNTTTAIFEIVKSEETEKVYPFDFQLVVRYVLSGNKIGIQYLVINVDNKDMYFSIGAHPGFNTPLSDKINFTDYYLEFDVDETITKYYAEGSLLTKKVDLLAKDTKEMSLSPEYFNKGLIIIKNLKSSAVALKCKKHDRYIKVYYPEFKYLGIWTKSPDSQFVCLEPWFGIADPIDSNGDFMNKEGIILLKPETEFACEHTIEIV